MFAPYSVINKADFDEVDLWCRINELTSNAAACQRRRRRRWNDMQS